MDPITLALLIGGGTSLISGFLGASASDRAATAQEEASMAALGLTREQYDQSRADAMPWLVAGRAALDRLVSGGAGSFQASPGYDFAVKEGEKGVVNNLRALGMGNSGAALKALTKYRTGIADQEFGNWWNRQAGLAGVGQATSNTLTNLGANFGNNAAQLTQDAGLARASGYTGGANAWSNALTNFSNNAGGWLGGYDSRWRRIAA